MRIDIISLFSDTLGDVLSESIIGRATERGILKIYCHQLRDYTLNKQKQVDDYPYGGGMGMILAADPLYRCWAHIKEECDGSGYTIMTSPRGTKLVQSVACRLAEEQNHLILVCGHYEGVDERFVEECVDEEMSIGDFVMTGGEIAALAIADSVCRLIPGVLSSPECYENESHYSGLLEHPQYTRPAEWHGKKVPDILMSGNHGAIEQWKHEQSLEITATRRPDMIEKAALNDKDRAFLKKIMQNTTKTDENA